MISLSQDITNAVRKYADCPDALWESISYFESGLNVGQVGDGPSYGGYSYGLFQLHVANDGNAQGNQAIALINQRYNLYGQDAINYLLSHVDIQAEVALPPINKAWANLKSTYNYNDLGWWISFCSQSGHPGGSSADLVTQTYAKNFITKVVNSNLFNIQNITSGGGSGPSSPDNTWLQVLLNYPPHQACNIIWRRTCPGAKASLEGGMDLVSANGTKVYALGPGSVIGAGYFWHPDGNPGYGVVTVRTTMPDGSLQDIYYQHITIDQSIVLCNQKGGQLYNNVVGPAPTYQNITKGQLLGIVTLGEVEVGINADWFGIWGDSHPNPWVDDPEDLIRSLINNGGGQSNFSLVFTTGNSVVDRYLNSAFLFGNDTIKTLTTNPGFAGPIQNFHAFEQFKPFVVPQDSSGGSQWPVWGGIATNISYPARLMSGIILFILNNAGAFIIRSFFMIIAFIIILALIINAFSTVTKEPIEQAGNVATKIIPLVV